MKLQEHTFPDIRKFIGPPNALIRRSQSLQKTPISSQHPIEETDSSEDELPLNEIYTLKTAYAQRNLVFLKWKNANSVRQGVDFYASHFQGREQKDRRSFQGQIREDCLLFDSGYESGNLLAVYRVEEYHYELILQNDSNSGGYTQWFNFQISNGNWKGRATFSIVNFYKTHSLYEQGMKPLSKSLIYDKEWKRSCHGVIYSSNELRVQGRKNKHYRSLIFNYDFNHEHDTVQFVSCFPYTYTSLCSWMATLDSPRSRIKYLGVTHLKKIIAMIHISIPSEKSKKAIVILGRQHPGQTPSSFVVEEIVEQLLGSFPDNELLLNCFDFYVFPMVNVDGVVLGNYRCNWAGQDLNRCWHIQDNKDTPEVCYIKSELKKILKRQQIQIILDIHGHSSKMNSFFYGNTFGKNNMALPYVVSKLCPLVHLPSCSFSNQTFKSNTARVVLGKLVQQIGVSYTFEISLFGFNKNGKKIPMFPEHYKQMGRNLLIALAKCQTQYLKQERALKGSLFLKEVRKQIKKLQDTVVVDKQVESDQEALKTTVIEERQRNYKKTDKSPTKINKIQQISKQRKRDVAVGTQAFIEDEYISYNMQNIAYKKSKKIENGLKIKKTNLSNHKPQQDPQNRKEFLLNKLRIFGETFVQQKSKHFIRQIIYLQNEKATQTQLRLKRLQQNSQKYCGIQSKNILPKRKPSLDSRYLKRIRGSRSTSRGLNLMDITTGLISLKGYQ